MNRRSFIALASGLLVPWQPERVYSFGGIDVPHFLVNGTRYRATRGGSSHWFGSGQLRHGDDVRFVLPAGFEATGQVGALGPGEHRGTVHVTARGTQITWLT